MFPMRSTWNMLGKAQRKRTMRPDRRTAQWTGNYTMFIEVSRVMRIGAFTLGRHKKLPWNEAIGAESATRLPDKVRVPQRAGQSRLRPEVSSPLLPRAFGWRTFRGPVAATRSLRTSDPFSGSWHLNARSRCGEPSRVENRRSGRWAGRKRSGAGREAQEFLDAPRKAENGLCPKGS